MLVRKPVAKVSSRSAMIYVIPDFQKIHSTRMHMLLALLLFPAVDQARFQMSSAATVLIKIVAQSQPSAWAQQGTPLVTDWINWCYN